MLRILLTSLLIGLAVGIAIGGVQRLGTKSPAAKQALLLDQNPAWRAFERAQHDLVHGRITKKQAKSQLKSVQKAMRAASRAANCELFQGDKPIFPVAGYGPPDVGKGFVPAGYDFFDGNWAKGHPAMDIFTKDIDQDALDDQTGKAIPVRAVLPGVVVSANRQWDDGDDLRGGKYIYVYVPAHQQLHYFAHLESVKVKSGQCVRGGDVIGTLGRSGKNAAEPRSPTHLHFAMFDFRTSTPKPLDPWPILSSSAR